MVVAGDSAALSRLRIVPASPSYFSAQPRFTDSLLELQAAQRKTETLPTVAGVDAPRVAWKTLVDFKGMAGAEPIKVAKYHRILDILKRLNRIHPAVVPEDVAALMQRYKRDLQPHLNRPKPQEVDLQGRAKGVGRRKTSSAVAWLVEGTGEVMVNGKSLSQMFGRVHDRESAIWALKATERVENYNIFALVKGGGVTGQAEALTMAVAKALLVHEPALKTALRVGKCLLSLVFYVTALAPQKAYFGSCYRLYKNFTRRKLTQSEQLVA